MDTDYTVDVRKRRTSAGRMNSGAYTVEIVTPDGAVHRSPTRFDTDTAAHEYADRYVAAHRDGRMQPASPKPAVPAPVRARRDRVADRVAGALGVGAAPATGRCHYCGGPLNRGGYCEECC